MVDGVARESGRGKAARVCSSTWIAILSIAIMLVAGVLLFGLDMFGRTAVAAVLSFVFGVAAFSSLGLMVAAIVPNSDATPAVANATLLPLAFVSNVFIAPFEDMPAWAMSFR